MTDALSTMQFDLYQRYKVLRESTRGLLETGPRTVLDVGSGGSRLIERFIPGGLSITRADVDQFGDTEVVPLTPGQPLPFDDNAFDWVSALEVMEHVPSDQREPLIRECARVSRELVILSFPNGCEEVWSAEDELNGLSARLFGQGSSFLEEHAEMGLPVTADMRSMLESTGLGVVEAPCCLLEHWALFSAWDLMCVSIFGDGEEKAAVNRTLNEVVVSAYEGATHYRSYLFASPDPAVLDRVRASLPPVRSLAEAHGAEPVVAVRAALTRFGIDLRSKLSREHALYAELATNYHQVKDELAAARSRIARLEAELAERTHNAEHIGSGRTNG
jgi:SAM-dependent methyltransferase